MMLFGAGEDQSFDVFADLFHQLSLVIDELLRTDKEIEKIVEESEKRKVKLVVFSHESDGGRELSGYGGFASLLRFRMR